MRKARLAPGEREEAAFRPAFASYLPWHAAALGFAALGAGLWLLFHSPAWESGSSGTPWRFWNYLYGNAVVAALLAGAAFALAGWTLSLAFRTQWPLGALAASGAGVLAAAFAFFPESHEEAIPLLTAALTPLCWALSEADRRTRSHHFTNTRIATYGGLFQRREASAHYEEVADLEWRRGPLARLFGHATLVPLTRKPDPKAEPLRLPGLRPYLPVRRALEALIQEATAGPAMRNASGLERRAADALADLQSDRPHSQRL